MSSSPRAATIRDVAAAAGVSTATVSRALRGLATVEPATRQRVEDAARRLRYRPSGVARSLRTRVTHTIGLIVTDIENPFFPQFVSAIEDAARERGYSVLLADGRRVPEREVESLEVLALRQVDGVIISSTDLTTRHHARIRDLPCPVVIANSVSTVAAVPAFLSDNEQGGALAVEHLVSLGHARFAYVVAGDPPTAAVRERIDGARAALERLGLRADALRVVAGSDGVDGGHAGAIAAMRTMHRPTALVCCNDVTAIGALRGLRSLGVEVPAPVSVIGFDDIELAAHANPPLTTIRQATASMAAMAVASLCDRITNGPEEDAGEVGGEPGPSRRLPVELVLRGSTAAPSPGSLEHAPAGMP